MTEDESLQKFSEVSTRAEWRLHSFRGLGPFPIPTPRRRSGGNATPPPSHGDGNFIAVQQARLPGKLA